MKYCMKCGAPMVDEALFCPKCGTRVAEVAEEPKTEVAQQQPTVQEIKEAVQQPPVQETTSAKQPARKAARPKTPLHEQKLREFLPVPLALVGCSIAIWIVDAVGHVQGIPRIFPLIIFMFLSGFLGVLSLVRAIKSLNRKIYFKAALSFVLFALLATCLVIDAIFLIVG